VVIHQGILMKGRTTFCHYRAHECDQHTDRPWHSVPSRSIATNTSVLCMSLHFTSPV